MKSTNPALADDIACISLSPMGLPQMLKVAYTYLFLWPVTFNAQKSYVLMSGKCKPPILQTWKLGEEKISIL